MSVHCIAKSAPTQNNRPIVDWASHSSLHLSLNRMSNHSRRDEIARFQQLDLAKTMSSGPSSLP